MMVRWKIVLIIETNKRMEDVRKVASNFSKRIKSKW